VPCRVVGSNVETAAPSKEDDMDATVIESPKQDLAEVLLAMQKIRRGGRVLSVYLDTSPVRTFGQGYLVAFHDACKALR
jgi:hypothetical protein